VQIASNTALWYHTGKQPVRIRWVLVHDPHGAFPTQCLLCTDPDVSPEQIIAWFVLRWQVELSQSHYPHSSYCHSDSAA
jgi:hypothetical protein